MNMVRCMLAERYVPKEFWPEAVNWAAYLLNRCPTFAVKNKTPEEAWSGFKPSVEHLNVFGCIGHVHISDKDRRKLDDKSLKCVFLGLSQESKAYRMYDPVSKKVVVSRDVVFEEDKKWDWGDSTKEVEIPTFVWGDEDSLHDEPINEEAEEQVEEEEQQDEDATNEENEHLVGNNASNPQVSSNEEVENTSSSPPRVQGRDRRPPAYFEDYVSGFEFDEETNLMMFTSLDDPISYEDAVKSPKWREAMT